MRENEHKSTSIFGIYLKKIEDQNKSVKDAFEWMKRQSKYSFADIIQVEKENPFLKMDYKN